MSWQHPSPTAARPPAPPRPAPASTALGVVALVTGLLALLTSVPLPLLDLLSVPLGVTAVATGVLALALRHGGRGLAVAGLVTGALGLLADLVRALVGVGLLGLAALGAAAGGPGGSTGTDAGEHAWGEQVRLDEYDVAVSGARTAPELGGLLLVELDVRFVGDGGRGGSGDLYEDLYGYLLGADGEEYWATDCLVQLPADPRDMADLAPGGSATFQMCFEVPPAAAPSDPETGEVAGVRVQVVDESAGTGSWATWADAGTPGGAGPAGPSV
ncbi:DUF4190 domain-containing protein [Kineococcus sp. SYSU DK006]|uniref:DUF4190 domain-containing protein n=1 Tax=Kineococcus sp. SYSU DK006 TaxID=3383127 RepID=UPI003D7E5FFC